MIMDVINATHLRKNLSKMLDQVHNDHSPVLITRQNGAHAVLISLEDYESYQETTYLTRSAANAQRLPESIVELETENNVK